MSWLTDPFAPEFMQRALLAGVLAVVASSLVGTWVVLRGLSFMGDALAHGVIPGIALALLYGFNLTLGALLTAAVMVAGVTVVGRRARLPEDTGIGLLFVGMLALGVIIISRSDSFATDVQGLLFGDVLGVTWADVRLQAVAALVVAAGVVVGYRPFLALSFNVDKAASLRLRPSAANLALLGLVTVAIIASFQAVGTLLVFGLLVGPPATAALLVRRVWLCMLTAIGLGIAAVVIGLLVSYHADTAAGATMAAVSVAGFFVVLAAAGADNPVASPLSRRRIGIAIRESAQPGALIQRRRRSFLADHKMIGKIGRVTGTIAPGKLGEVMISVRGGSEAFHAYGAEGDGTITVGSRVVIVEYFPPRTVIVTPM